MGGVIIDEHKRFGWFVRTFFIEEPNDHPPKFIAGVGILLLFLATFVWYVSRDPGSGVPLYEDLKSHAGEVETASERNESIRFRLSGSSLEFFYASKSGSTFIVQDIMKIATIIGVKYRDEGPQDKLKTVFEVSADGRVIRSYQDIKEAWIKNDNLGPWLYFGFSAGGIWMFLMAYYTNLNNKMNQQDTQGSIMDPD